MPGQITRSSETSALNGQVKELTRTLKDRTESKRQLEEMQARERNEYDSKVTDLAAILR